MTKRDLFCFHSTKKTALFLLRIGTHTLFLLPCQAEITYSTHLSLSPCNASRSFHTLSPTPVVPGWDPLWPMPLSLSLSLSVPPAVQDQRIPGDSTCPPQP